MTLCPKCGAMLRVTTTGETCQNCGWSAIRTSGWASDNTVNLPLIIPKVPPETRSLETVINDLTIRVDTLEADLERLKRSTRARFENTVEQIGELRERCDRSKLTILSADVHEKTKEDLLRALKESNAVPIIDLPKPIRYVYIIRERTSTGWTVVGNTCYSTFESARKRMKTLLQMCRQWDKDYDANNLNIVQVKVKE